MRYIKNKILAILVITTCFGYSQTWRSSLYPASWKPGYTDNEGRFLHDFSYAGYHSGLEDIPDKKENLIDVSKSPFNADKNGKLDATEAIQKAIDVVGAKGGGVVFLPKGEYKISVPNEKKFALTIRYNNTVLRGEGETKTFIKCVTTNLRSKSVINLCSSNGSWGKSEGKTVSISTDLNQPTNLIPVKDVSQFKIGDHIIITSDVTDAFATEHGCLNYWKGFTGPSFCREITNIDSKNNCLQIDAPTRYYIKIRDFARVYKIYPQLTECGLENFSIGNVQNPNAGWDDSDFAKTGTGAYEVHSSQVIEFKNTENCWIKSVSTYKPAENDKDVHILSNCLILNNSRFVTVEDCNFQKSQYKGEGGNGYLYCLVSNDCLIKDSYAENGRHNYDFKMMESNGNVILNCKSKNPRLGSDFHMQLSMANLFDGFISDGDYIDASFRPYGTLGKMHMYSTTQSVMWNTIGVKSYNNLQKVLIDSRQFGQGYVICTSGNVTKVVTTPVAGTEKNISYNTGNEDYVEGIGRGETLLPRSLYLDQLQKRKTRLLSSR